MELLSFEHFKNVEGKVAIYAINKQNSRELWNLLKERNTPYEDLNWGANTCFEAYGFGGFSVHHSSYLYYKSRGYVLYRYKDIKNKLKKGLYWVI